MTSRLFDGGGAGGGTSAARFCFYSTFLFDGYLMTPPAVASSATMTDHPMTPDELARVHRYIEAVRHDDTLTGLLARYALALLQRIEDDRWT